MNKELILKYEKEFDHWLKGGRVLRLVGDNWIYVSDNFKWIKSNAVVIDDKYVELRKALAMGKTIQIKNMFNERWIDLVNIEFTGKPEYYRVKEEPNFEVGFIVWYLSPTDNTVRVGRVVEVQQYHLLFNNGTVIRKDYCYLFDGVIPNEVLDVLNIDKIKLNLR